MWLGVIWEKKVNGIAALVVGGSVCGMGECSGSVNGCQRGVVVQGG